MEALIFVIFFLAGGGSDFFQYELFGLWHSQIHSFGMHSVRVGSSKHVGSTSRSVVRLFHASRNQFDHLLSLWRSHCAMLADLDLEVEDEEELEEAATWPHRGSCEIHSVM